MGAPKVQDLRQSMGPKGCLNLVTKWGAAHLIPDAATQRLASCSAQRGTRKATELPPKA